MGNIKRVVAGIFVAAAVSGALAIAGAATASAASATESGVVAGTDATAIEYGLLASGSDVTPDIVAGAYK
jgi:hypothetical protein